MLYCDEVLSGTSSKSLTGFNQMDTEALDGVCNKINLIVTKSISCFARKKVDRLMVVRQLKEVG